MPDLAAAAKPVTFNRWETLVTAVAGPSSGSSLRGGRLALITAELVATAYAVAIGQPEKRVALFMGYGGYKVGPGKAEATTLLPARHGAEAVRRPGRVAERTKRVH
jgi:hypothetical protein